LTRRAPAVKRGPLSVPPLSEASKVESPAAPPLAAEDRRLLALLSLAIFFEGYGRSAISVLLPTIGAGLGVPAPELSFALAAITAGSLGVLVLGELADRFGRRRLLLASVLLYAVLGATSATAGTLVVLVLWQSAARMFQEGALSAATVIAVEEMPAAHRGIAQGVLGTVNSVGSGLTALLLGFVALIPGGWRGVCALNATPLLLLPFLRRTVPESRRWMRAEHPRRRFVPRGYRRRMAAALVVVFLAMSYDVAGFAFTTYWPMVHHGWSAPQTSSLIVIAGGLGLPGFWVGGRLTDRAGRRVSAVVFFVGLALAEALFFQGGPTALWPAFMAMVFCQAGKITVIRSWTPEIFPTSFRGTAAGWLAAGSTLGAMAGLAAAGLMGRVLDDMGLALTIIAIAGVAAAAVAWTCLPETGGLELEVASPEPV
jgi:putative MFS transporter